jgi:hypothetical protein
VVTETSIGRFAVTSATFDNYFTAIEDIRRRRMDDAARDREARAARRADRRGVRAHRQGELAIYPARPRRWRRWLALS